MRTIIAGPRDFTDAETLNVAMRECGWFPTVVLSGKCRGVDALGEAWALEHGIPVEEHPADWTLGKKAGPIRNEQMGKRADALVAIWNGISTGTGGMIGIAKRLGLRYYVHRI